MLNKKSKNATFLLALCNCNAKQRTYNRAKRACPRLNDWGAHLRRNGMRIAQIYPTTPTRRCPRRVKKYHRHGLGGLGWHRAPACIGVDVPTKLTPTRPRWQFKNVYKHGLLRNTNFVAASRIEFPIVNITKPHVIRTPPLTIWNT